MTSSDVGLEGVRMMSISSHASPTPSPSISPWSELILEGQLSQASPTPSLSASFCRLLEAEAQLSQAFIIPSLSVSDPEVAGHSGSMEITERLQDCVANSAV